MPSHTERQRFRYSPAQLFALVADVEKYPDFLPWCRAARILRRESDTVFLAELMICFSHMCERYTSKVTLTPSERIDVELVNGPFEHLTNRWQFHPLPDGGTEIDFFLDFKFRSRILEKLIGGLFAKATARMVEAFRNRAEMMYGSNYP